MQAGVGVKSPGFALLLTVPSFSGLCLYPKVGRHWVEQLTHSVLPLNGDFNLVQLHLSKAGSGVLP